MHKRIKPGTSYLYKLMYSYGAAFLLMFFIYAFASTTMISEIKKAYEQNYLTLLETSRDNIDNDIMTVTQLASFIASDTEMIRSFSEEKSREFVYDDFQRREYLKKVTAISNVAEDVYIYNKRRGRIISASTTATAEEYFDQKHRSRRFTLDSWLEILNMQHRNELVLFGKNELKPGRNNENPNYIAYLRTLSAGGSDDDITLVILINTEKIIGSAGIDSSDQFAVLDRNGTPMISIGDVADPQTLSTLTGGEYRFGKKKYNVSVINSAAVSWKYIMISRYNAVAGRQRQLNIIAALCLLLFVGLSVLLTYIISKSNYRPVERLIDIMNVGGNGDRNEFSVLESKISEMRRDYTSLVQSNRKSFYRQRDEYFKRVIEGFEGTDELFDAETTEKFGFDAVSERFAVMLVTIKNTDVFVDILDITLDMAQYAMRNVMLELIEDEGLKGWTCSLRPNTMGVLVNFGDADTDCGDKLMRIARRMSEFFRKYYYAELITAIGGEVSSMYEIENSYKQAQRAASYAVVTDANEPVASAELEDKRDDYVYTIDSERKIIAALRSGDFDKSRELMDELYDTNVLSRTHSASAIQLFMLELYRTLSNVLPNAPMINFADFERSSAADMYNKILKSVAEYCNLINCRRQRSVGDKVKEYIEENYRDQNLSVGSIGEYFGLTPSYLSKLFREETDETILNFIHIVRIRHAGELLRQGKSVEKTASLVGYTNVNSFTRVYKKITGITPKMTSTKI